MDPKGQEGCRFESVESVPTRPRWTIVRACSEVGGAVSAQPLLTDDAVYVVTDEDTVVAMAREDGEALWRVRRDAPEGFTISEHAGLVLGEGKLVDNRAACGVDQNRVFAHQIESLAG